MSSTITHAVSASWIAVTATHIQPGETGYILAAVISASVLDVDHIFFLFRDRAVYRRLGYRGQLHHARSALHELFGLLVIGIVSSLLYVLDPKLAGVVFVALTVHIAQDWVLGRSRPLTPVDDTEMHFFSLTFKQIVFIDIATLAVFGGLWILYLAGHL